MSDTRLPLPNYEPYVVSDERIAEIRAMFTDRDEFDNWRLEAVRGVTKDDLVGAVYDLLGERDDRNAVCTCGHLMGDHDQYGCTVDDGCERKGATVDV